MNNPQKEPSNYLDRLNKLDAFISEALNPKEEFYIVQMPEAQEKKYEKETLPTFNLVENTSDSGIIPVPRLQYTGIETKTFTMTIQGLTLTGLSFDSVSI